MGVRTGLLLEVGLKKDETLLKVLGFMFDNSKPYIHYEHEFFFTPKWKTMFHTTGYDRWYPQDSHLTGIDLRVQCNIKNYHKEIELFLDWISPHVDEYRAGYYEHELTEKRLLIEFEYGKLVIKFPYDYYEPDG